MRWRDIDSDRGWWTIPSEASKDQDAHRVPLTAPVLSVLRRRRAGGDDEYVFSNYAHSTVSWRAKKAASSLSRGLSFEFRAHDLRRTAASYMGEAGIDRFHIALVLNHRSVTHSTVTAIYDRYRYDKEKRAALEGLARLLEQIVRPPSEADEETVRDDSPERTGRSDLNNDRDRHREVRRTLKGLPLLARRVYWLRF